MLHVEGLEERRLFALAGSLDPSYGGGDGRNTINFGTRGLDTLYGSAVQADGKVILVGSTDSSTGNGTDIAVVRLNPDTTLDQSFGVTLEGGVGGGLFELGLPTQNDAAYGVAVQSDGKIVIVGSVADTTSGDFFSQAVVIRLTADGVPDETFGVESEFGGTGFVLVPFSFDPFFGTPNSEARAVGLLSDGSIVIAGASDIDSTTATSGFAMAKLQTNGVLDTSFGTLGTGIVTFKEEGFFVAAFGLAVDSFDRIVLAGTAIVPGDGVFTPTIGVFLTARFLSNGVEDFSYGDEGAAIATYNSDGTDAPVPLALTVAIQPDGKILAAGVIARTQLFFDDGVAGFAVARFNTDGTADTSFGGGTGAVETYFDTPSDRVLAVANQIILMGDGRFLVIGKAAFASDSDNFSGSAIARYRADGSLDPTFNQSGKLLLGPQGAISLASANDVRAGFDDAVKSANTVGANIPGGGILLFVPNGGTIEAARLIADGADLVAKITTLKAGTFLGGTKSTLSLTLSNQGNLPFSSGAPIRLKLSSDQTLSGDDIDIPLSLTAKGVIAAGKSKVVKVNFTYPTGDFSGNFFVLATTNDGRSISEGNFLNNVAFSPFQVSIQPAFIELSAELTVFPTTTVLNGKKATFTLLVKNTGTIQAKGNITLQLFGSTDETLSGEDLLLAGAKPTKLALKPGNKAIKFSTLVPKGTAAGSYNLILKLDATALGGRNPFQQGLTGRTVQIG